MSRRKRSRDDWPFSRYREGAPGRKTDRAPPDPMGLGRPPTPESARELGRAEGRSSMLCEQQKALDEKIDQVRADAQALETTARILDDAPPLPRAQAEKVRAVLFAMAAGMRLAADRFPDSREIPF